MSKGVIIRQHNAVSHEEKKPVPHNVNHGDRKTFRCPFCHNVLPFVEKMNRVFIMYTKGSCEYICKSCKTRNLPLLKRGGVSVVAV